MRYPAAEKLEIIRLVEHSHLPVRRTLDVRGVCGIGAHGRNRDQLGELRDEGVV